ncbi:HEAT repeat domain-containing protein [Paenibacillus sp. MBLB4367]|uniref:HEAT repeat domain-containing protein n=1 Tax=Paenibacillus sp. MBLB4367 TaxID=3384767 RepID=UPI00390834A8
MWKWLGVRADDMRKLWLMLPVFFFGGVAELLNYTGFMALFNQRFGVQNLPLIYMAEALILPFEGWILASMANRMSKPRFMRTLYVVMTGAVLLNAGVLLFFKLSGTELLWYYPILFLSSNFVVRQMTLLLWSTAFDLCPTQQAKRLMPLFVAGATVGGIAAGFLAQGIGPAFGTEYVYLLSPIMMLVGYRNFRVAIKRYLVPLMLRDTGAGQRGKAGPAASAQVAATLEGDANFGIGGKHAAGQLSATERAKSEKEKGRPSNEVQAAAAGGGTAEEAPASSMYYLRAMLKSPFLLCAVGLMTLMPALYFMIEYQYFYSAEQRFPVEADLTSFYGMMVTLLFTVSLLLQTVSGRLMNWLGASNLLLAVSVVFLGGFVLSAIFIDTGLALFAVSLGYGFFYVLLYYFAEPCYQLFFKMLPISQRDGFRFVAQGIAASGGILLGALLSFLHSSRWLPLEVQSLLGVGLAILLLGLAWYGRMLYVNELVRSVQSLQTQISELAASFLGGIKHAKALAGVVGFLKHPSEHVREVALEIVGHAKDSALLPQLVEVVSDASPRIRVAALKAMSLKGAGIEALAKVASFLEDEDEEVRSEGVRLLARADHMRSQAHFFVRMKLLDKHPRVIAEAVKSLYALRSEESYSACGEALDKLLAAGGAGAVEACRAIGELRLSSYTQAVSALLDDERPAVKVAAVRCLGLLRLADAVPRMLAMFPAADQELRRALIEAMTTIGDAGAAHLYKGLRDEHPLVWKASVSALCGILPSGKVRDVLVETCAARIAGAQDGQRLSAELERLNEPELAVLAEQRYREIRLDLSDTVWLVLEKLADEQVVASVRQSIEDQDEETRENGLEILAEGIGDRRLSQALLELFKGAKETARVPNEDGKSILIAASGWSDHWLKEIAAHALAGMERGTMQEERKYLSMLDKVIFLKQVTLFSHLSVDELGLIAGIAQEETYPDQTVLLQQGEPNPTMYIIVEGTVELSAASSANGWEGTIGVLGQKEAFGDTTALDRSPSAVTAQAIFDEVRVLALKGEGLSRLVRLYPEIGIGLLHASGARVRLLESMLMKMG